MPVELERIKQEAREPHCSPGKHFLAVNKFKQSYDYTNRFISHQCPFFCCNFANFFPGKGCVGLHLSKLDSPSQKDALFQVWVELGGGGLVVLEKMKM